MSEQVAVVVAQRRKVSRLVAIGTVLLVLAAPVHVAAGNIRSLNESLLSAGQARNQESAVRTWGTSGFVEAGSAAALALALGLMAGGMASTMARQGES